MGETFYTILGVSPDADAGAIRRAYREQVKECHPDVSDDPEASERFKRLTTARDVLLDTDERTSYDRLGHDDYVRQHVDSSTWDAKEPTDADDATYTSTPGTEWGATAGRQTQSQSRTDEHSAAQRSHNRSTANTDRDAWQKSPRWSRSDGGYEEWQRAPDAYMNGTSVSGRSSASSTDFFGHLRQFGPWIVIHVTLIGSALATSWFVTTRPGTTPMGTAASGLFSLLLVAIVLLLSALHILTELS